MYKPNEMCSYEWYSSEIIEILKRANVYFMMDITSCTLHIRSDNERSPLTEDEKRQIHNYITIHNYPFYYNVKFDN